MTPTPDFFDAWQYRIDSCLQQQLAGCGAPPRLAQAMAYSVFNGGKRIRPLLAYLSSVACDVPLRQADIVACALELIHTYSLVHDDLPAMDDDNLRRGQPTCHIRFDEATAILAGDGLQALAFTCLSTLPDAGVAAETALALVKGISVAAGPGGMVRGQVLDMIGELTPLQADELRDMHAGKTGALITAAALTGPTLAQAGAAEMDLFRKFGDAVGLAFQIRDDILDVTGDPTVTGKSQSDERNGKSTFVSLMGLDGARTALKETLDAAHSTLTPLDNRADQLRVLADFIASRAF